MRSGRGKCHGVGDVGAVVRGYRRLLGRGVLDGAGGAEPLEAQQRARAADPWWASKGEWSPVAGEDYQSIRPRPTVPRTRAAPSPVSLN